LVMRMRDERLGRLELLMALHAVVVVLRRRFRPTGAQCFVRVVALDASELRIARPARGIGILGRVPRGHAGGELRAFARMASAAGPIDIGVRPAVIVFGTYSSFVFARDDRQLRSLREEERLFPLPLRMVPGSEVAGFTTDAERHRMV